jgi:hypothetical protein
MIVQNLKNYDEVSFDNPRKQRYDKKHYFVVRTNKDN